MEYKLIEKHLHKNIDTRFAYMMLNRLQMDCKYYLGYGNRHAANALWARDERLQIALMRELYDFVPEKPEWLTLAEIDGYEKEMLCEQPKQTFDNSNFIIK